MRSRDTVIDHAVRYQIADLTLASEIPLPELSQTSLEPADWSLELARPTEGWQPRPAEARWHHWIGEGRRPWASFRRTASGLVMRFPGIGTFVADAAARRISCRLAPNRSAAALRQVVLNQVMPILMAGSRLVLHASGVAGPRGALVFAGPQGRGKSTLAVSLARAGHLLVSDDFVVIDEHEGRPVTVPSGLDARLWPDSIEAVLGQRATAWPAAGPGRMKRRVAPGRRSGIRAAVAPVPLQGIYLIAEGGARVGVAPLAPHEAVAALTASSFLTGSEGPGEVRHAFERVAALVGRVPVRRLTLTRDLADLPRAHRAVLADAVS